MQKPSSQSSRRCENLKLEYWDYFDEFLEDPELWFQQLSELKLKQWDFDRPDGTKIPAPRLSAWHAKSGENFDVECLNVLAGLVEKKLSELGIAEKDGTPIRFNAALVHLYRSGKDHIGWHHDREADDTFVVGLSFGGVRKFKIRRRGQTTGWLWEQMLKSGSCFIMYPGMQSRCQHMIMKTNARNQPPPRISVTLRQRLNSSYADPNGRTIKLVKQDLFQCDDNLAHCVSQDFHMGAGIAKEFKRRFGCQQQLRQANVQVGKCAALMPKSTTSGALARTIFYLVTKEKYWHKPTYEALESSLADMFSVCRKKGIESVSMPKIGCGLDNLEWPYVVDLIEKTRGEVKVTVYYL